MDRGECRDCRWASDDWHRCHLNPVPVEVRPRHWCGKFETRHTLECDLDEDCSCDDSAEPSFDQLDKLFDKLFEDLTSPGPLQAKDCCRCPHCGRPIEKGHHEEHGSGLCVAPHD